MIKKLMATTSILACGLVLAGCATDSTDTTTTDTTTGGTTDTTFDTSKSVTVYTRDTSSGTRDGFFTTIGFSDAVKDNSVLKTGYVEVAGNGDMITAVKNDEYGIGYISLSSYATSGLTGLTYDGVVASEDNVISGDYKLTRNFNYMTREWDDYSASEFAIVEAYVAFLSTEEALVTIAANDGIVDIPSDVQSWDDIKADYTVPSDASSVTIKFGGSTSVEKIATALSGQFSALFGNFEVEHEHTGSSDAYARLQGDEKDGTNKIHVGFASREFKDSEIVNAETSQIGTICVDAIVAVVNSANTVYSATNAADLVAMYSGTKTKWSELE